MKRSPRFPLAILLVLPALLSACASAPQATRQLYDLGPAPALVAADRRAPVSFVLADIQVAPVLDNNAMLYRLQYDNLQQLKPYAQARWSMAPAQLLNQRFRTLFVAHGERVLSPGDGQPQLPVVRIDLDEFSQVFSSPANSEARLQFRVAVIRQHQLIAQRNWLVQVPAASADAGGGARAMQEASDRAFNELRQWLHTLPLNPPSP